VLLVSIIMPCYNSETTISQSIKSVIEQSYQNWELLVIDDLSTDLTEDMVLNFCDTRIKYFCLEKNSGSPAEPRNLGLRVSKGKYIAFLDSDDLWHKTKLEKQVSFMHDNNYTFTCTAYNIIDDIGNFVTSYTPPKKVDYNMLLTNNSIGCLTAMVSKELLEGDKFSICGHEDFALWLRIIKKSKYVFSLNDKLASYRRLEGSVSSNKVKLISFFWHVYRNEQKLSIIKSLYYCFRYFFNVVWIKYK